MNMHLSIFSRSRITSHKKGNALLLQRLLASVHDDHLLGAMGKMWCLKAEDQGAVPGLTPVCAKRRLRVPHLVQGIPKKENTFNLI